MSMITEYVRVRPAELVELKRLLAEEPDDAYEFAGDLAEQDSDEDDLAPRGMDTDKAWAGLQYLLSELHPPVDVISGGATMTDDGGPMTPPGFSPCARFLAANFHAQTPFSLLPERYDLDASARCGAVDPSSGRLLVGSAGGLAGLTIRSGQGLGPDTDPQ